MGNIGLHFLDIYETPLTDVIFKYKLCPKIMENILLYNQSEMGKSVISHKLVT